MEKKMTIFGVWNNDELESYFYAEQISARQRVLDIIKADYGEDEIRELAQEDGYDDVEGYLNFILICDNYDETFDIEVCEYIID